MNTPKKADIKLFSILLFRTIVLFTPAVLMYVAYNISEYLEKVCDWLDRKLPEPHHPSWDEYDGDDL